jgi:hypothetical protein
MVQPLFRRRIHRGLNSISPCGTAGADFASPNRAGRRDAMELLPSRGTRIGRSQMLLAPRAWFRHWREARKLLSRCTGPSADLTTFGPADQATSGRHRRPRPDSAETMTIRKRSELFGNGQLARFWCQQVLLFSLLLELHSS